MGQHIPRNAYELVWGYIIFVLKTSVFPVDLLQMLIENMASKRSIGLVAITMF